MKPNRHWVMGAGGWQSHDRSRCVPKMECQEILCPPAVRFDKHGNEKPWEPRDISILIQVSLA